MTDSTFTRPRQRVSSDGTVRRRAALYFARPYLERFPDWQRRAAHLSALLLARALSAEEKAIHLDNLSQLIAEVESARDQFGTAAKSEPPHDRIDDVRNAFRRLLEILRSTGSSNSP